MLTEENDVEIHALAKRGWSVSAISRHTGRDRKTVAKYLKGEGAGQNRVSVPSCLEPFRGYIEARFDDDAHVEAMVLFRELVPRRKHRLMCGASTSPTSAGVRTGRWARSAPPSRC